MQIIRDKLRLKNKLNKPKFYNPLQDLLIPELSLLGFKIMQFQILQRLSFHGK
jgi:hypothetical protein